MTLTMFLAAVCLCGEAPERKNDFFWENERVGFRAYGPKDPHKWSGIDVFNKNTTSNIVCSWLRKLGPSVNWHKNVNGFGMDDYTMGPSRGVGGVALRKNGKWLKDYGDWVAYRVIKEKGNDCAFELDYHLPIGGTMTLAIRLERGKSLFREEVRFSADAPMEGIEVGVGLDVNPKRMHGGDVYVDEKNGVVSLFEDPHKDKDGKLIDGEEGSTMGALVAITKIAQVAEGPEGEKMLMTAPLGRDEAKNGAVIAVWAGADWSEAGRYRTPKEWHHYVTGYINNK